MNKHFTKIGGGVEPLNLNIQHRSQFKLNYLGPALGITVTKL